MMKFTAMHKTSISMQSFQLSFFFFLQFSIFIDFKYLMVFILTKLLMVYRFLLLKAAYA